MRDKGCRTATQCPICHKVVRSNVGRTGLKDLDLMAWHIQTQCSMVEPNYYKVSKLEKDFLCAKDDHFYTY